MEEKNLEFDLDDILKEFGTQQEEEPAQEAPAQEAFELNLTGEEAPKAKKAKKEKKPGKKLFGKIPLGGAIAIGRVFAVNYNRVDFIFFF